MWREAAAYLIAVRTSPRECSEPRFRAIESRWLEADDTQVIAQLKQSRGCRAAKWLLGEGGDRTWHVRQMKLAELQMRGGGGAANRAGELLSGFKKSHGTSSLWTVAECADLIQAVPEHERDRSVAEYLPEGVIPDFLRTLVVGREKGNPAWVIGDGYHRAVVMWILGAREVNCYAGELVGTEE